MLDSMTVQEMFVRLAVAAVAPDTPEPVVATVRHLTNTHGEPVVRRVLRAAHSANAVRWAPGVTCPALVLSGEFDTGCPPEAGIRMADAVAGRDEVLGGVGHLPMIEDPPAVLRLMLPHLHAAESRAAESPARRPPRQRPRKRPRIWIRKRRGGDGAPARDDRPHAGPRRARPISSSGSAR